MLLEARDSGETGSLLIIFKISNDPISWTKSPTVILKNCSILSEQSERRKKGSGNEEVAVNLLWVSSADVALSCGIWRTNPERRRSQNPTASRIFRGDFRSDSTIRFAAVRGWVHKPATET